MNLPGLESPQKADGDSRGRFSFVARTGPDIGEDFPSIALSRFLGTPSPSSFSGRAERTPPESGSVILASGRIPFPLDGSPLPISLSVERLDFHDKETIRYLRAHAPVGCRDQQTTRWCVRRRIPWYFASCVTILLERTIPYDPDGPVVVVDVNPKRLPPFDGPMVAMTHRIEPRRYRSTEARSKAARKRIDAYQRASLVITSRMEAAMACLGMDVPVIVVEPDTDRYRLTALPGHVRVHRTDELRRASLSAQEHRYDVVRWKGMVGFRLRRRIEAGSGVKLSPAPVNGCTVPPPRNEFWRPDLRIPAKAHFIWLGGPLPAFVTGFVDRFRSLHPDWEVTIHRTIPADMPARWYRHIQSLKSHAGRSDWIRLWLVHKHGGFYIDTDMWTFRSYEPLRNYSYLGLGTGKGWSNNALIAESAGGPVVNELIRRLENHHFELGNPQIVEPETGWKWSKYYNAGPAPFTMAGLQRPDLFHLSPNHWFQCAHDTERRLELVNAADKDLPQLFDRDIKMPDGVHPFGLHCGSEVERLVFPDAGSGSPRALKAATIVLNRLPPCTEARGVAVGGMDPHLASELLAYSPHLRITFVASGPEHHESSEARTNAATGDLEGATDFAAERSIFLPTKGETGSGAFTDRSLDFVYIQGARTAEEVGTLVDEWLPKVKPEHFLYLQIVGRLLDGAKAIDPRWNALIRPLIRDQNLIQIPQP